MSKNAFNFKYFYENYVKDEEEPVYENVRQNIVSSRGRSWEYCYKFFQDNRENLKKNVEQIVDLASLNLAFYLASWGMYRGSSFLLQMDYTVHKPAVRIISKYFDLAEIDIDKWNEEKTKELFNLIGQLEEYYGECRNVIRQDKRENISETLITKILLGTLGITPAYDRYFKGGLGKYNNKYSKIPICFTPKGFDKLIEFCKTHRGSIQNLDLRLKVDEKIAYPFMKKVDILFWNIGIKGDKFGYFKSVNENTNTPNRR